MPEIEPGQFSPFTIKYAYNYIWATGWTARVRFPAEHDFSSQHPDRFWDPPSHLYNGYRELFPRGEGG
jgi:hypothetical protein